MSMSYDHVLYVRVRVIFVALKQRHPFTYRNLRKQLHPNNCLAQFAGKKRLTRLNKLQSHDNQVVSSSRG